MIVSMVMHEGLRQVEMEASMGVRMAGTVAYLEGDWTMTGVAANIDSMVLVLNQLESGGETRFQINCGQIEEADTSGLQLLNVWLECARLRGIEPSLVSVPDCMRRAMREFGFSQLGETVS